VTPVLFDMLAALLKARSGLAIGRDKLYLLETRLAPILREAGLPGLDALALRLRGVVDDALAGRVVEAMTTNETSFFRDGKPFAHFRDVALPAALAAHDAPIRIWSAASASGQEAYSLAMILADSAPLLAGRRAEILGTDLSAEQVARAQVGLFSHFEIQRGLPMQLLVRHFRKEDAGWRVKEDLRASVRFREWNLLSDLRPLGVFDIVFCRNVLIYFDPPTKARVLDAICRQMAPHGVLYLGGAETALGLCAGLAPADGHRGAFVPAAGGDAGGRGAHARAATHATAS